MSNKKLTKCQTCSAEIAKKAKTCPHCGAKNERTGLWAWLIIWLLFAPLGALYTYAQLQSPTAAVAINPNQPPYLRALSGMTISAFKWEKTGFDVVLNVSFKLINNSDVAVKDPKIRCSFYAPSGTKLGAVVETFYENLSPGEKLPIKRHIMGLIDPQVEAVTCEVVDVRI